MSEPNTGGIAHVARFVVDDFISRINDGSKCQVHRLAHADRDENLVLGIVGNTKLPCSANGFAQLQQAKVDV